MPECLFCRIAEGVIPVQSVFEDADAIAFPDIAPKAPTHLLVIPKVHFNNVQDAPAALLGRLLEQAGHLGKQLLPGGHRIVINTGDNGGQTVHHLHLHLLGGRPMGWPPG